MISRAKFLFLLAFLILMNAADIANGDTYSEIDSLESEVEVIESRLLNIETDLLEYNEQLQGMASEIRKEKSRLRSRDNLLRRLRVEKLLKKSRTVAQAMNLLRVEKNQLLERSSLYRQKLEKYFRALLRDGWLRLFHSIRAGDYDAASEQIEEVRRVEKRIRYLTEADAEADYTKVPKSIIESNIDSYDDWALLLDMVRDLKDGAVGDSIRLEEKIENVNETITMRKDLLKLLDEAGDAVVEGGAFFSDFDREEAQIEIARLAEEKSKLEETLKSVKAAIAYYTKYVFLIERLQDSD